MNAFARMRGRFWRAADRWRTKAYDDARFLARAQWWNPEQIKEYQIHALGSLLRHAVSQVPYYSGPELALVHSVVESADVFAALHRFPPMAKDVLRSRLGDLRSGDAVRRGVFENASGGSTGVPVRFWQDRRFASAAHAVKMLFDDWTGYEVGEPQVRLWGSARDLMGGGVPARHRIGRWFRGEHWLGAFTLGPEEIKSHVAAINHQRPTQILAYASALHAVAVYCNRTRLVPWSPRAIITSAGTLTEAMRVEIESAFRAPVFDRYGSREAGDIAMECDVHAGLHVVAPFHVVEVVDPDGNASKPGEVGEVLVTPLCNWSMPLIRYRTGDLAEVAGGACGCGRHWPRLRRLTGRLVEAFVRADGGMLLPEAILHLIGVVLRPRWVGRYQVIQRTVSNVLLRVMPAPGQDGGAPREADIAKLEDLLSRAIGVRCTVEVEQTTGLVPTPSGKLLVTMSEVTRG